MKSARMLLDEASKRTPEDKSASLYAIEEVALPEEEGYIAFAFVLPDLLRKWGGRIRELQMDSTCECPDIIYVLRRVLIKY
jgi:hypothetical protein